VSCQPRHYSTFVGCRFLQPEPVGCRIEKHPQTAGTGHAMQPPSKSQSVEGGPGTFQIAHYDSGVRIGGLRSDSRHNGRDARVLVSSPVSLNVVLEQWRGRSEQPDSSCALAIRGNRNLAIDRRGSGGPRNQVTSGSAGCTMFHAGRASFTSTEVVYG
jgi:hypothetical protein